MALTKSIVHSRVLPAYSTQQHRRTITSNTTATQKKPTQEDTTHQNDPDTPISASPPSSPPPSTSLSDQVRLLMRRIPYPVAIITATDPDAPTDKSFRGMTVSSFNTVTLTPQPVVSFNVRRPSETLNAILSSQRFLVHLLAPNEETAALARDFSRGNTHLSLLRREGSFEFVPLPHHRLDGDLVQSRPLPFLTRKGSAVRHDPPASPAAESEHFPFVFECVLNPHHIEVFDHTVVLGRVVRTLKGINNNITKSEHLVSHRGSDDDESTSPQNLCLAYANTRFWKMGHEI